MRFADEPGERVPSRLITRLQRGDPRGPAGVEGGGLDAGLDRLTGGEQDL
jgi:hypothetical protein